MTMKVLALALSFLLSAKAAVGSASHNRLLHSDGGCGGELVQFETSVLVDIDGFDSDPNDVTRVDWDSLELLFADSYNILSADLCDDHFREIIHATIERDGNGAKIIKRGGNLYSIRLTIEAKCRGCVPDEAFLFSPPGDYVRQLLLENNHLQDEQSDQVQDAIIGEDGTITAGTTSTRQRDLKSSKKGGSKASKGSKKSSKNGGGKGKGESKGKGKGKGGGKGGGGNGGGDVDNDDCDDDHVVGDDGVVVDDDGIVVDDDGIVVDDDGIVVDDDNTDPNLCDCLSSHPEYRPPTEEEFRVFYSNAIHDFKENGQFPTRKLGGVSVDVIVKVTEIEELSCSVEIEEFSTLVSVEFFGDSIAVTEDERLALEEAFLEIYNGLASNRCDDPLFRNVTLTEIAMQADPTEPKVFIYIFRVDGTCRGAGCSENQTIFEPTSQDSMTRSLQLESEIGPSHDTGAEGNLHSSSAFGCACPLYPLGEGAPTAEELEARLFIVVQDLISKGILENIGASGSVVELPYNDSPTPSPSGNATEAPTISTETDAPTAVGVTDAPTVAPTAGGGPTVTPTTAGSATPAPSTLLVTSIPTATNLSTTAPTVFSNGTAAPTTTATTLSPTTAGSATPAPSTLLVTSIPTATNLSTTAPTVFINGTAAPTTTTTGSNAPSSLASGATTGSNAPSSLASGATTGSTAPSSLASGATTGSNAPSSLASGATTTSSAPSSLSSDPALVSPAPTSLASGATTGSNAPSSLASGATTGSNAPSSLASGATTGSNAPSALASGP